MFTRTIEGLCLSLQIGLLAAGFSVIIAVLLGTGSATLGKWADGCVTYAIDLVMSMPHLVLLILLSFVMGGGGKGVILAVAVSHWPRLARIIRAEVLQLQQADYVRLSRRLGRSPLWIARHHMLPHLFPQILIGVILLFPHAILHAAGLTFLGFGLSPNHPSIGVLLSESMRHLSTGYWWLAVFPGAALVMTVKVFDILGTTLKQLYDPKTQQE
jgi:peptide/nickel transport system permease protein